MDIKADPQNLDFESEWNALPSGEGVTPSGASIFTAEQPTSERMARAWAFMARLEAESLQTC
ncbi:hypothetical protein GCM10008956_32230 [Deinococcus arenae]|uniref:Uncharacterized protein n=1 Tax=Deinococcus arenae TaxID=1452751 RepID=A0A8H9GTC1_9DEIO|nr:hypothetical protein [Deinococcus arenae]GGM53808.1 hypothetical protein GCM10008956_32230 [Deinococcus arenae]